MVILFFCSVHKRRFFLCVVSRTGQSQNNEFHVADVVSEDRRAPFIASIAIIQVKEMHVFQTEPYM